MMGRADVDHIEDWPPFVPFASAAIVAVNLSVAVMEERFNRYSLAAGVLAAGLAFTPFFLDVVAVVRRLDRTVVPLWLFPIPVFAGIAYLLYHPANVDVAPFVLIFLNGELVSRSRGNLPVAIFTGLASVGLVISAEAVGPWTDGSFIWVIGIAFGWMGGFLIRELTARSHQLEAAQAELAEKAAAQERSRIAREVHDVIAHSLSVTMLHVTAARMALQRGDRTEEALDALKEAEQQGRNSLAEIRRTVGLLGPDESAVAPPMPTAADLPKLVQDFRNAGLDATLWMEGDVTSLPETTGLNVYRIVQESLTNVTKHAPGAPATVELNVGDDDIRLRVHNANGNGTSTVGRSAGGGLGLRGIAERAGALGGTLATNDRDGFTVLVVAPRLDR